MAIRVLSLTVPLWTWVFVWYNEDRNDPWRNVVCQTLPMSQDVRGKEILSWGFPSPVGPYHPLKKGDKGLSG